MSGGTVLGGQHSAVSYISEQMRGHGQGKTCDEQAKNNNKACAAYDNNMYVMYICRVHVQKLLNKSRNRTVRKSGKLKLKVTRGGILMI